MEYFGESPNCAQCGHSMWSHELIKYVSPSDSGKSKLVSVNDRCLKYDCDCYRVGGPISVESSERMYGHVTVRVLEDYSVEEVTENKDLINHPAHYTDGSIEVWDYIDDKTLGYFKGNAVKYISRAGKKSPDTEIQDLEKAIAYLNREIKRIKQSPRNPGQKPIDYAGHTSIQGDN